MLDQEDQDIKANQDYHKMNSDPGHQEKMQRLIIKRQMSWNERLFSSMHEGSLRTTIITFVRLCLGLGIFVVPFYAKDYGLMLGLGVVLVAGFINYTTFKIIYSSSEFTKKESLPGIVDELMGKITGKFFRWVIFFEMVACMVLYAITVWNLF